MNSLTPFPFPVQWHEGMLLVPEHFQHADRRIDQLFSLHLQTYIPYYWGIKHLEMDANSLLAGILRIQALEAVLPDGTYGIIRQGEGDILELNLLEHQESFKEESLVVHLAISGHKVGYNNLSADYPRFSSFESGPLADENTGEGQRRIPLLKPNLLLLPEDKISSRFETFPLVKVNRMNNTFSLATSYRPPQIRLEAGSDLSGQLIDLCKTMREKISFISSRLQHQSNEIMTDEAQQAMSILCMSVVPLETLLYAQGVHPFQLYVFLTQIAGYIAPLKRGELPPFFKAYDHRDLKTTFDQVIEYIKTVMSQIQEGFYILPFNLKERLFTLPLKSSYISPRMVMGARASKTMSVSNVTTWIHGAVIATENHVRAIRDKRVLGAVRHIVKSDESMQLMAPKDVVLFAIEYDPSCMDRENTLCIFNVADSLESRPEEVVLYLPKKENV